jgi:hypothetical protein
VVSAKSFEHTETEEFDATDATQRPRHLTGEDAKLLFDQRARELLGMSGAEFKRKWEAGEIENPDRTDVLQVWMLLPWAE